MTKKKRNSWTKENWCLNWFTTAWSVGLMCRNGETFPRLLRLQIWFLCFSTSEIISCPGPAESESKFSCNHWIRASSGQISNLIKPKLAQLNLNWRKFTYPYPQTLPWLIEQAMNTIQLEVLKKQKPKLNHPIHRVIESWIDSIREINAGSNTVNGRPLEG